MHQLHIFHRLVYIQRNLFFLFSSFVSLSSDSASQAVEVEASAPSPVAYFLFLFSSFLSLLFLSFFSFFFTCLCCACFCYYSRLRFMCFCILLHRPLLTNQRRSLSNHPFYHFQVAVRRININTLLACLRYGQMQQQPPCLFKSERWMIRSLVRRREQSGGSLALAYKFTSILVAECF